MPPVWRAEVRPLDPEQARTFLVASSTDRLATLYLVALGCGLRQGEALGLTWSMIDFDGGTLTVARQLQRVNGTFRLVEPKTKRSRRTLPLPDLVLRSLRAHRNRQLHERMMAGSRWQGEEWLGPGSPELVFTTSLGTPLYGSNVTHRLQAILERAGLPRTRFHDLRHAYASFQMSRGVHPRVVMELLGHSQIALTMDLYSHVMPSLLRESADQIEHVLSLPDQTLATRSATKMGKGWGD